MAGKVSVRAAHPADAPLILDFIRQLAQYERLLHEVEATEADIRRDLFGENPRCFCEIAEVAGTPVGFALWFYSYSTFRGRAGIYVEDLFIEPQARGLGAGPWAAFRRVTLPLSLPGVVIAGQLCLIWALGAFVGPVLLGGPDQTTLAVWVQKQGLEYGDWPRAAATAVLTVLTVAVCVALYAVPARKIGGGRA